ncbi:MAG: AAA family ATPase [Fibrobacter sp.]|nr:AAA family ATPase [Fibrobacter sp.]
MSVASIFKNKGYEAYVSQDFYSDNTFIEKFGRNAEHIDSNVNGKNSAWPNVAHIILPYESYRINVIAEAHRGSVLSYLQGKFNKKRNETFIYQPTGEHNFYQKYRIFNNTFGRCVIEKLGEAKLLNDLVPIYKPKENLLGKQTDEIKQQPILDKKKEMDEDLFENDSSFKPSQVIFYGVPGSGKSEKIKERLRSVPEYNKIRVVFHPEYTSAEFIGSILPCVENRKVSYKFTPGPFSRILRRAYLNPDQHFYLIIEEINRGHADAIFGESFQLFDRIKNKKVDEFGYKVGWSSFPIENMDISEYIRDKKLLEKEKKKGLCVGVKPANFFENEKDGNGTPLIENATSYESIEITDSSFKTGKLVFSDTTMIRFPPNLSILGTMNTSDQNIFSFDNAFQRRIDLKLVANEFEKGNIEGFITEDVCSQYNAQIAGTSVTWGVFWKWINNKIVQTLKGLSSTEDKRLGVWFVSNVDGKIDEKVFCRKSSQISMGRCF